jgi:general secretion pathway protein I
MKSARGEAGQALIDAMIGSAIIATTLVAMFGAISESAARNRMAEQRRTAMLIAQSELASVGSLIPAMPGLTEGTEGDFYWRVDIEPYDAGIPPSIVGQLCKVVVVVADARRAPLATLTSMTLARGT